MSLNDILGAATSGLSAAQAGLRTVSNNIANVGTPGYARERVNLSSTVISGRVTGVSVGEPVRVADAFLEETVYRRAGETGQADAQSTYLSRLQSLLGTPGSEAGISARIDAVLSAATEMTGTQNSRQTASAFTAQVQDVVDTLQQLDDDAKALGGDVENEIGSTVDRINVLLKQVDELNVSVASLQGLGRSPAGIADQRTKALEELSSLISVNVRAQPNGKVTIETTSGVALLDGRLRQLSYAGGSNGGIAQPSGAPITVRFADDSLAAGASTGERIDVVATGGKLGGLIGMRDDALPEFSQKLTSLFNGFAQAVNSATNASTTVPPPNSMAGRPTGLIGADRLGFTGQTTFAVTDSNGTLISKTTVDFDALGPAATVNDAINAINAGLGGTATASLDSKGVLTLSAAGTSNGIVVAQGNPASDRGGVGFAQYFGLNDLVRSESAPLVPSGLTAPDPHGFTSGQTANLELRDGNGKLMGSYALTGSAGSTMGDLVTELNGGSLGSFGTFAMGSDGRFTFTPIASASGGRITITSDSTDRLGTGQSFSSLSGFQSASPVLQTATLRPDMASDPRKLPIATFQDSASIGQKALGAGDISGATRMIKALSAIADFGADGHTTLNGFAANLIGDVASASSRADAKLADTTARKADAVNRRDSFSGVNLDEELSQMVVLQNSYAASARVISVASAMYETLINMI